MGWSKFVNDNYNRCAVRLEFVVLFFSCENKGKKHFPKAVVSHSYQASKGSVTIFVASVGWARDVHATIGLMSYFLCRVSIS